MTEDVSRRKMLSLLGFGAALGFTLSAAVEPLEAEAQTVAQAAPATPATPAARPLRNHRNTRQEPADIATHHSPSATGTRATVNLLPALHRLQRNSDPRRRS